MLTETSIVRPAGHATGAGRSTVAEPVTRFDDATGGAVRLDGIDVRDLPRRTCGAPSSG